ncbi:MAG: endonuclease/exonuclease/phosphatase family protein [Candidatus Levybacteria bacterium]|nr:endonuclease/exonuclease/phosphatase family protein [Candidatus Levybacteria bacterium]
MKLKVIQLNIWRGTLLSSALDFLIKEDPDVILLQEVYSNSNNLPGMPLTHRLYQYLQEKLPDYEFVYGPAFTDTTKLGNIESGNAIFSKFKIIDSTNTFFDVPYKTFDEQSQTDFSYNPQTILGAKLDVNGVECNAFSVHGIWGHDGRDSDRRLKMGEIIIEQIKDKQNVILGGDFNINPDTQTISSIERYVKSVFENTLTSTFNMKHKTDGGYATATVDMMFCSKHIKVLSKECLDINISDHLPLVVEFEL